MNTQEKALIDAALAVLECHIKKHEFQLSQPQAVVNYLRLKLELKEHEVFGILFLDGRNCVIAFEELFRGTINTAAVYPREVIKRVLMLNAASMIIAHNHPSSGVAYPSHADRQLTARLVEALQLIDVPILDHIIIGSGEHFSFKEQGLLE